MGLMNDERIVFEKYIFSGVPQVAEILALPPSIRRPLLEEGVPQYFFFRNYAADPALSVIHFAERSPFVRFGADCIGMMGVDSASGHVIHMRGESWERASFVNTTIDKFTETARSLAESFPYGASCIEFDGVEEAANTIREIIRSVDEAAIISGNYWPDFADEIDGQLYGVGEILQWHRRKPQQ
jgi:hypothetical protein